MILALLVWLVMTAIPAVGTIAVTVFIILVLSGIIGIIRKFDFHEPTMWDWTRKQLKWAVPLLVFAMLLPSEKTSWYMIGAYTTQTIAQSDTGKELADDGVDVLKSLMKKAKEKIDNYDAEDTPKEKEAKPK